MNERIRELCLRADIPEIDGCWDYNDRSVMTRDSQTDQWREATPVEIMSTLLRLEQGINRLVPAVVRECANALDDGDMDGVWSRNVLDQHFGLK